MDGYKKWNIGLSVVIATLAVGIWLYWEFVCAQSGCQREFREFILRPTLWSSIPLAIILISLLAFPSRLFRNWLSHIALWSIPLAIYIILGEDPRSSSVLSFGRGLLSWILGTLIFILTVIYATGWHFYSWKKGRMPARNLLKLFLFIIPAVLFYAIWQLF